MAIEQLLSNPIWWQDPRITAPLFSGVTSLIATLIGVGTLVVSNKNNKEQHKISKRQQLLSIYQLRASFREKRIYDFETTFSSFVAGSALATESYGRVVDLEKFIRSNLNPATPEIQLNKRQAELDLERHFDDLREANSQAYKASAKMKLFLSEQDTVHKELIDQLAKWNGSSEKWKKEVDKPQRDDDARDVIVKEGWKIKLELMKKAKAVIDYELEKLFKV